MINVASFTKGKFMPYFYVVKRDVRDISCIVSVESVLLSGQKSQCLQEEHVLKFSRACEGMPKVEGILLVN